ncbi:glycosyltransferase family 8 protein [Suhomyces tanzawaensis NRRL Y-17324]|uniref:glycogenin glucosyltransferase n=1 Tax=Suhomyces tanzawaensis NRRL Y-17324 TaxID=984487 RepID=A0A1E4SIN7_9ASCO|nr:glycosyltransferase family 8 protein [Suhomyces tanzawaensis NRRL Y-17324]ODV79307.1 glycosyltransferase family 8 protein [Suhomyces tanzawaensis NRRL Y-17324]
MTKAYITLLTDESYLAGALTLAAALRHHGTIHKLVILLTHEALSSDSIDLVHEAYDEIVPIDESLIQAPLEGVLSKLGRAELSVTYSKFLLWNQTQYDQLIYLDSDTLPLTNLDELFVEYSGASANQIVASPDSGWPDIFNSGVLVLKPSTTVFEDLLASATTTESFDGADQGLLNEFFNVASAGKNWIRLPFLYNVTPNLGQHYQYLPAFTRFFKDIKLLHFFGKVKPWHLRDIVSSDTANFHHLWWALFNKHFSDPKVRARLLQRAPGEGYKLRFEKYTNTWDEPVPGPQELAALPQLEEQEDEIPSVFPWEQREHVAPTRVFNSFKSSGPAETQRVHSKADSDLRKNIESLSLVKIGSKKPSSLLKNYHFSEEGSFNPDQAFEEVSKIPLQFLSKQNKKNSK